MTQPETGHTRIPAARRTSVIRTNTRTDVVVYDQSRHQVHHLNAIAAQVWDACDGRRGVIEIAEITALPEATVVLSVRQLAEANLLEGVMPLLPITTRRTWLKAAAIPVIATVSAPLAAAAGTGPGGNPKGPGDPKQGFPTPDPLDGGNGGKGGAGSGGTGGDGGTGGTGGAGGKAGAGGD